MALKEEFDYLSFRCCYCLTFNPSRKKRPIAPKLDNTLSIEDKRSDMSDSASDSDSDTAEPIITEPDSVTNEAVNSPSDSEKFSDFEIKNSDTESTAMDVDKTPTEIKDSDEIKKQD